MRYAVSNKYFGIKSIFKKGKVVESFEWDLTRSINVQIIKSTLILGNEEYGLVFESGDHLIGFVDDLLFCFSWIENDRKGAVNNIDVSTYENIVREFKEKSANQKAIDESVETDEQIEEKMKKFSRLDKLLSDED